MDRLSCASAGSFGSGLCNRPSRGWPSQFTVSIVKFGTISPVDGSVHSDHRPAIAQGSPSARVIRHQTLRPVSQFGSWYQAAGIRQRWPAAQAER